MAALHVVRFVGKILKSKLVKHKKFGLLFTLASLLDKGMQPINYKCVNWLIYGDQEPFIALDSSKMIAIFWVYTKDY